RYLHCGDGADHVYRRRRADRRSVLTGAHHHRNRAPSSPAGRNHLKEGRMADEVLKALAQAATPVQEPAPAPLPAATEPAPAPVAAAIEPAPAPAAPEPVAAAPQVQ